MDGGDLAKAWRVKTDPVEGQLVLQVGGVGKPAAQAVDRLADNHVELLVCRIGQQLLEAGPEAAGATDGSITVVANHGPALSYGIAAADLDLILDRGLALQIGGVAGIDDGAHGWSLIMDGPHDGPAGGVASSCPVMRSAWRRAASTISAWL